MLLFCIYNQISYIQQVYSGRKDDNRMTKVENRKEPFWWHCAPTFLWLIRIHGLTRGDCIGIFLAHRVISALLCTSLIGGACPFLHIKLRLATFFQQQKKKFRIAFLYERYPLNTFFATTLDKV